MFHQWILLFLAMTALAAVSFCDAKDLSFAVQLKKDFEKINQYLEKNVPSDDPEVNMAKIGEMLQSEEKSLQRKIFGENSMVTTAKKISTLATLSQDGDNCRSKGKDLMLELDYGLADESRQTNREYPLTRVDKILGHYALKNLYLCNFYKTPDLHYALKQVDYDHINRYLVESMPEEQDIEANMAKAEELLNSLSSRDGALAKALEQLLALRSTVDPETCGPKGVNIIFKNEKSARLEPTHKYSSAIRRVDKIIEHYTRNHEALCRVTMRDKFGLKVKDLGQETYHNVLALVSVNYLPSDQMSKLVGEIREKEVNEDFTIPSMVEHAKVFSNNTEVCPWLKMISTVDIDKLYNLATTMSAGTEEAKYLVSYLDEISGQRAVHEDRLKALLDRHFFIPCTNYLDALEELEMEDNYYFDMGPKHFDSIKGRFVGDLSYFMARQAYLACKYVNSNQETLYKSLRIQAMLHR